MIRLLADTICYLIRTAWGASTSPTRVLAHGLLLIIFSTGCAAAPAAPSLLALRVAHIHESLEEMAASYQQKDITRFLLHLDPSSAQRSLLQDSLDRDFNAFSEMALDMRIQRVEVTDEQIWTDIAWEGRWTRKETVPSGSLYQTGLVLIGWSLDESPRLLEIRGDIPWGAPPISPVYGG